MSERPACQARIAMAGVPMINSASPLCSLGSKLLP